jgi:hypothetical protein
MIISLITSMTTMTYKQKYIPMSLSRIKQSLFENWEFGKKESGSLIDLCTMLEAIYHHNSYSLTSKLKSLYEDMNPDTSGYNDTSGKLEFIDALEQSLLDGNWEKITADEIQNALHGEDILPISLDVRFDEFDTMELYKLGEKRVSDIRTTMFGLRSEEVDIDTFNQVLQIVQYKDKSWFFSEKKRKKYYPGDEDVEGIHLRLFRSVPKLDLETIFPNTTPLMRNLDKLKIAAPLIGGLVALGIKYTPILFGNEAGDSGTAVLGGLLTAVGSYVLKTYISYQKTREKFQTQVSKDMYFKGQANNSAVINMIVDIGEEQEIKEALIAYFFILLDDNKYNQATLDKKVENWILQKFSVDIDFEVDDALEKLSSMNLLIEDRDGFLSVVDSKKALIILDRYWDNLYNFA